VKEYERAGARVTALTLGCLGADAGEAIAVTGPSGSGKTTLLRVLAALTPPTRGEVFFGGRKLSGLGASKARWRASSVGYVCQNVNLLPDFSVFENLTLAGEISGVPKCELPERANCLLRRLGLGNRRDHRPAALSLGEQQRAAIARAVIHRPPMLLADEPTASLDAANTQNVVELMLELCAESNTLLFAATHDEAVRKRFPRTLELRKTEGTPS
jgi:ABC-type lipoprotein export system ATPase subunit